MADDPVRMMRGIKKLIESLPQRPDELGFAGRTEQQIASLYFRLGDLTASGDWWVRAALEAEKYHQVFEAKVQLELAANQLPDHLGIRRELKRLEELIARATGE